MDLILLISIAVALLVISITAWFFTRKSGDQKQNGKIILFLMSQIQRFVILVRI